MPHPEPIGSRIDDDARRPSRCRLLQELFGGFEARHGRSLLLPFLVFFRRLRRCGDQRDPRQPVVHDDRLLHLDTHQLQHTAEHPSKVGGRKNALRRGCLGVAFTAIKKERQEPGQRHQSLPRGRPGNPPGDEAAHRERKDRARRPQFGPDLESGAVAENPVAGGGPGSDPRPPTDKWQDGKAASGTRQIPLRAHFRPCVVGTRDGCPHCNNAACVHHDRKFSRTPRHRAGSSSLLENPLFHQLMPFRAMTSASRLGAISRASWRSIRPRSIRLLRLCVKSCMPSFTDFLMWSAIK